MFPFHIMNPFLMRLTEKESEICESVEWSEKRRDTIVRQNILCLSEIFSALLILQKMSSDSEIFGLYMVDHLNASYSYLILYAS